MSKEKKTALEEIEDMKTIKLLGGKYRDGWDMAIEELEYRLTHPSVSEDEVDQRTVLASSLPRESHEDGC